MFLYEYMKTPKVTRICGWCDKKKSVSEDANTCKDCLIEGLRKIGWGEERLAGVAWSVDEGHWPHVVIEFEALSGDEREAVLKKYAIR